MAQDTDRPNQDAGAIKYPDEWVTGDEPMTGAQKSYPQTLSRDAGEALDETLSKAGASRRIDELQEETGRGSSRSDA